MNNKLPLQTPNLTAQNIDKIAALFPNCITEMLDEEKSTPDRKVYKRGINFELLKQMLSPDVVDGDEAYEFTWVGKKASIVEANKPIRKTLRPCPAESKNWDDTENLYIEGDNLEVLKLLRTSYLHKVKMIYIDPPYNTGNDFIYADDFMRSQDEENRQMGMYDEDENRLFKNNDSNGRFHSDWCSMMYSRLMLARNLLTDDGVIFISVDDNEVDNLLQLCNEIFNAKNRVGIFTWLSKSGGGSDNGLVVNDQEYILCYAKNISVDGILSKITIEAEPLDKCDSHGPYRLGRELNKWGANSRREDRPTMYFPIDGPNGEKVFPIRNDGTEGCWRWGKTAMETAVKNHNCEFVPREDGSYVVYEKIRTTENRLKPYRTFIPDVGATADGSKIVKGLFDNKKVFDFPKPLKLISYILNIGAYPEDAIVLDFFAGSSTTAQALMNYNATSGGHRKFIMVQLPEPCDEDGEAYKAGYKNICEIGKERIRRAGEKIKQEDDCWKCVPLNRMDGSKPGDDTTAKIVKTIDAGDGKPPIEMVDISKNPDVGFRVFKLDDTNMKDVYYSAEEYSQTNLEDLESNIKEDRTDLDLLFGCLLDWGLPLSMPYRSEKIGNCTVHTYAPGDAALNVPDALIACFDSNVPENVIKEIAKRKPRRAVFRDSSFASSPEKINVFEIFKLYAPDTDVKVI